MYVQNYKDNPLKIHVKLDQKMGHTISNYHFGIWLRHWIQTVDTHFCGDTAEKAKHRARNIGSRMFMVIFLQRKQGNDPSKF